MTVWRLRLGRVLALVCCLASTQIAFAIDLAATPKSAQEAVKFRDFNETDFLLAYQAELEAGKQERAFVIAQQAVSKVPGDRDWRLRLAQIAEWTSHPDVAAQQWSALFQMGDHSAATLNALVALAPMVDDNRTVLQAWSIKAQTEQLSAAQWNGILSLFERMADPAQGSAFFEQQYRRHQDPALLETAARLAEHAGDVGRTVMLSVERSVRAPLHTEWVQETAAQLVRWDCLEQARDLLLRVAPQVSPDAFDFWDLLGQIAWRLNDTTTSEKVYRNQIRQAKASEDDWSRLILLVRQDRPQEAATLSLQAYAKYARVDDLLLAMSVYATAGDDAALARTFQQLQPSQLEQAETSSYFLLMRASYYQRIQQPNLAWADLEQAQRIDPDSTDVALDAIWFLINQHRLVPLQRTLQSHAEQATSQPDFWAAYAAGNQLLGNGQQALYWYKKQLSTTSDDLLQWLNYADALQTFGHAGMAARVRRYAWEQLLKKYAEQAPSIAQARAPEMLALARLMLLNRPGDPSLRLVRQLVQVPADAPLDREIALLVFAWALGSDQYANAREWMWQHFVQQSSNQSPQWAQAQIALQLGDRESMRQLLAQDDPELPVDSRYEMADLLGHHQQALEGAFNALEQDKSPEIMQERLQQYTPSYANYIQLGWSSEDIASQAYAVSPLNSNLPTGALHIQAQQEELRLTLTDHLQLKLQASQASIAVDQPAFASQTPNTDTLTMAQLHWADSTSASTVTLFQRSIWEPLWGVQLEHNWQIDMRWDAEIGLDYQTESTLSVPIRLDAYENDVHASVGYSLSKREQLRVSLRQSDYFPQGGAERLATGNSVDIEGIYRLRIDYPDWRLRLMMSNRQLSISDNLTHAYLRSFIIPDNATSLTGCIDMGSSLMGTDSTAPYSAAWRPFLDTCLSQNDQGSGGWDSGIGIVGSALGRDQVYIEFRSSNDSSAGSTAGQTLTLRYRKYF
jgi:hypothetical protein